MRIRGTGPQMMALVAVATMAAAWPTTVTSAASAAPSWGFAELEQYETGSSLVSVAVDDADSDGWNDVLATTSFYFDPQRDYHLWLFRGGSDGALTTPATTVLAPGSQVSDYSVAAGDLDGDGYSDVVVSTSEGIHYYRQQPDSHGLELVRTLPVRNSATDIGYPAELVVVDVDGDGMNDLMANTGAGVETWVQRDGVLERSAQVLPKQGYLAVGDVTGDGRPDVVGAESISRNVVLVSAQRADGSFDEAVSYTMPGDLGINGVAVGDLNDDGLLDVAASQGGNVDTTAMNVLLQQEDGALRTTVLDTNDVPETVQIGDVTGDGRADLVVLHGGWTTAGIYEQAADGTLLPEHLLTVRGASHYHSQGLSLEDVSGDGLGDLVVADQNDGVLVARAIGTPPPLETEIRSGPTGPGAPSTAVFALAANRGGPGFECSLDGAPFTACATPVAYEGLEPGSSHTLAVRAVVDGATDPTPAVRAFTVARLAPESVLHTDRRRYRAGQSAHISVDVHGSETRAVTVTAERVGREPVVLFEGVVPDDGLELDRTMRHTQTITVQHPADARHDADATSLRRTVRLGLETAPVRHVSTHGRYAVFRRESDARFRTTTTPARPGACLRMAWQVRRGGTWSSGDVSRCQSPDERGRVVWPWSRKLPGDTALRVRSTFAGDESNAASRSAWVYFRFRV